MNRDPMTDFRFGLGMVTFLALVLIGVAFL